jgi:uncharacterized membrane-anchored protein
MAYTLKARRDHTLTWNGKEHKDGDTIQINRADAERIALGSEAYRFVPKDGGDEISHAAIDEATAPAPVMAPPPEPKKP